MVTFNANSVVAEIDVDDPWFKVEGEARIPLPGSRRYDNPDNVLTRKQMAQIIRGCSALGMGDLPFGEAADVLRDERHANIRGRQRDFSIIDYLNEQARKPNVHEPLTSGQAQLVATVLGALSGTEDHWDAETQRRINALSDSRRDRWAEKFEDVETQGELNTLLTKFNAIVGDLAARRAKQSRSTVTEAANAVDIGEATDVTGDTTENTGGESEGGDEEPF